ncbi:MAG: ATP-binding protein [Myxococcota bacterium]
MANLSEGSREHEEIHNLSREVTLDYHGRFLLELIQNAVDALPEGKPGKIHLILTPTLLAVLNQGQPFSPEGLEAITSMALSPKRADESIGNKGIGFKSVFEVSDAPELYSVATPGHSLARHDASGTQPRCRVFTGALGLSPASPKAGFQAGAAEIAGGDSGGKRQRPGRLHGTSAEG